MVQIRLLTPRSKAAKELIEELDAYKSELYPADSNHLDPVEELEKPHVHFLGAFEGTLLLGCGAVKLMEDYGEIKRMYVRPGSRGKGVGRSLLLALESIVKKAGLPLIRLETGVRQQEALRLYKQSGYTEIAPFGDYRKDPLSVFLEKRIGANENTAAS